MPVKRLAAKETGNKRLVIVLILFITFVAGIFSFLYFRSQVHQVKLDHYEEIRAIAHLKYEEIQHWRSERISDADFFSSNPVIKSMAWQIKEGADTLAMHDQFVSLLSRMSQNHRYENILLADHHGRIMLSLIPEGPELDQTSLVTLQTTIRENKIVFGDLYFSPALNRIHLDVIAPVHLHEGPPAFLVFCINPEYFLYPLIRSWPSPSKTSETILVRKDADSVMFLNEIRHKENTALRLKLPLSIEDLPAVKALKGDTGMVTGVDYRGAKVLADIRPLQGTSWFMVAKVDSREVYDDMVTHLVLMSILIILLMSIIAISFALVYSSRQKSTFRQLFLKEKELRLSQEEFRTTLYSIGDAVIIADKDARLRYMNKVAEELTGWHEDEARGEPLEKVFRIINEQDRQNAENPVNRVLREGKVLGLANHTLLISKEGKEIPIADSGAPVRDLDNVITGVVLVFHDQTMERSAQRAIEETNKLLNETSALAHIGGWRFDPVTLKGTWTEEVARIHELDPAMETSVALGISFYLPASREKIEKAIAEAIQFGKSYDLVLEMIAARGTHKWVRTIGHAAMEDGRVVSISGLFQDITDHKIAEEEILTLNQELERRVEMRTDQLRTANQELEAFAYTVSHDLRAPLRAIDGFSAILMEDYGVQLDEEGLRITQVIRQNAQKMGKLIDELLNFSRLGRSDMVTVQIDMQEMAKNCFEELVPVDKRQHVGFTLGDLHPVSGDAGMIRQVWLNLFSNALKFSSNRSNPLINVFSRYEDRQVIFTVQDNGAGFDMKYAEKLFGVFHRLHGTNEFEGTGVGLAIVHRIVTRHGGNVWAEGQVNKGASFSFSIPL